MEDLNNNGIPDQHEAKIAKADLYKLANYSMKLFKMIQEGDQMESWVQAKIMKAADYIASVYHYMEFENKTTEYGDALENAEMYSESVRRAFEQKLNEAKACKKKIAEKAKQEEIEEGFEDRLAAAREKAAAKGKIKSDDDKKTKPAVRKIAGKNYGGSKQKDDDKVDEGFEDRLAAAKEKAAAKGKLKDTEPEKKSPVRKVAGKNYGGSKQKDDDKVDESIDDSKPSKVDRTKEPNAKSERYYAKKAATKKS